MKPAAGTIDRLPIFALGTVLFPGGLLPLRVFEARYMDMCKACLKDGTAFGICSIVSGSEVGAPAEFAAVGTIATITHWDMEQLGILSIVAEGGSRFAIEQREVASDGLARAHVRLLVDEAPSTSGAPSPVLVELLRKLMEKIGNARFPAARNFEDANWVSYRLAEILPIKLSVKQNLLEVNDSEVRLSVIAEYLRLQGISTV